MVSRNLERANENDGFKMTALETLINYRIIPIKRCAYVSHFGWVLIDVIIERKHGWALIRARALNRDNTILQYILLQNL